MDIIKRFSNQPVSRSGGIVRTLSIDLGTTNSTIAESIWLPGYPPMCRVLKIIQPLATGTFTGELVPSFLAVTKSDTVIVGEGARRLRSGADKGELGRWRNYFYETKNDMGLNKTYAEAPAYLDHAYKAAGYLLAFLVEAAEKNATAPYQALTVTVPASFQMNQRQDTLRAAQMADLHLGQDSLLEEPAAALIDYLMSDNKRLFLSPGKEVVCLIFDYGGGTCDVSVVSITSSGENKPLTVSERSVSRYHRLGGGDIDAAIVHEALIPALMTENKLGPLELTWENKKLELEPQLIATAEILKIDLCRKIRQSIDQCEYAEVNPTMFKVTAPDITCRLNGRDFHLSCPSLSAAQFEGLLEPFLDTDHLYARETEYRLTQSIFSPIEDALDRAGIDARKVDFCLITGGSVLIPQVRHAIEAYFGKDKVGCHDDPELMQTAVARGAAWNTIFKTITGRPLIQPVLHDGIDLETNDGNCHTLIEPGTPLPWPEDGSWRRLALEAPKVSRLFVEQLRFKLMSGLDGRHLLNEIWDLPQAACPGDEIIMEYRVTAGKQFECRAFLKKVPDAEFIRTIENPLVNVVNPGSVRLKIEETEEMLRRQKGGTRENVDDYINLAEWYAELNQHEKALHCLHVALKKNDGPNASALHLQGNYYGQLKNYDRAEKAYQEAWRTDPSWTGPLFNLALLYRNTKRHDEALNIIDKAMETTDDAGAFLSLKANILHRMEKAEQARKVAGEALERFLPLKMQSEWELGWYLTNARFLKDDKTVAAAEAEKERRKKTPEPEPDDDTPRPVVKGNLVPFNRATAA
ncbi:MAG: Hsp70 family protein [Thermodesulfobacteriota bacterium]